MANKRTYKENLAIAIEYAKRVEGEYAIKLANDLYRRPRTVRIIEPDGGEKIINTESTVNASR